MLEHQSSAELLSALRQGDERAAEVLFQRYLARLTALVRARLSSRFASRLDPEDIVMSAWRSFFVGARSDRFLADNDGEIWPLLVTITLRKLTRQTRAHSAGRRDVSLEESVPRTEEFVEHLARDPSPVEAAIVSDAIEQLLTRLDPLGADVLLRQLNGADGAAIARELGCTERTVRRVSQRIRGHLKLNEARPIPTRLPAEGTAPRHGDASSTHALEQLTLHEMVGQGAFSKVFRATDTMSSQTVAVKFLRKSMWSDPQSRQSIQREFAALREISHPNVLRVHGWGETPAGGLFLVSEFLEGHTLDGWERGQDVSAVVAVLAPVAETLCIIHAHGLIHGDLKPQNIIQTAAGRIVLMDFGMSRWFQQTDDQPPRGGTAGYLSPEQITPAFGDLTNRTDIYAWGALAYAMLTGQPPFLGRDLPETLSQVLSGSVPPLSVRNPSVPAALDTLVLRCLSKSSADRPSSMEEIVRDLAIRKAAGP